MKELETNKVNILNMGPIAAPEIREVQVGDAIIKICVKLPYEDLLVMTQWCVDVIIGDKTFISEPIKYMVQNLALCKFYTNIDIDRLFAGDDFSVERLYENFDLLMGHKVFEIIEMNIDRDQYMIFQQLTEKTLQSIIDYKNSALGIVDMLSANAKEDGDTMQKALSFLNDKESMHNVINMVESYEKLEADKPIQFNKE